MKGFVVTRNPLTNTTGLGVKVTNEYKTRKGIQQHALDGLPVGYYQLQVFYNWDRRYSNKFDFVVNLEKK